MTPGAEPPRRPDGDGPVLPLSRDEFPASAATPPRHGSGVIRPVPQAGAPSFESLASRSVLSRARDNSRFDAPAAEPGDVAARTVSLRVLLIAATIMIGLGVAAGVVWVTLLRDAPVDEDTLVTASETAGTTIRTPQETVRGYLEALEEGDIEAALAFGPLAGAGSRALLTPAAHAAMPEESRPTNIAIATTDPRATEVAVTYTVAGEDVNTAIRVIRLENGSYELLRSTVTIQLEVVGGDDLPVLVNGIAVDHTSPLEVVPGTYTLSTGLPFIAFQDPRPITILSLAHTDISPFPVSPELTDAGQAALLKAAQASLAECVASTEIAPKGCPNAIDAPKSVVPGSVSWTLLNRAVVWQEFKPTLSPLDQTVAQATLALHLNVTMRYTDGHTSGNNPQKPNVVLRAPMLGSDPAAVKVSWER